MASKKAVKTTVFATRDGSGSGKAHVYFWRKKPPQDKMGAYTLADPETKDGTDGEIQKFDAYCQELDDIFTMFGVAQPKPGECVKLILSSVDVCRVRPIDEMVKDLQACTKHDPALMHEAALTLLGRT